MDVSPPAVVAEAEFDYHITLTGSYGSFAPTKAAVAVGVNALWGIWRRLEGKTHVLRGKVDTWSWVFSLDSDAELHGNEDMMHFRRSDPGHHNTLTVSM